MWQKRIGTEACLPIVAEHGEWGMYNYTVTLILSERKTILLTSTNCLYTKSTLFLIWNFDWLTYM